MGASHSRSILCSPQANIARNVLEGKLFVAELPRGNKKKESFSWWIKLHIFYVKVSWEIHLGMRDCHPRCWGEAVCSPLGQLEPLPSSLEIPRKQTRLVLTSSPGGFCSALLCRKGGCCKPIFWGRSSWARGGGNGVLAEELLNTDTPLYN